MIRAKKTGTSSFTSTLEETLSFNRAGNKEENISKEEVLERYIYETKKDKKD